MNRSQAMSLLKDLVSKDLVEPSYIHIFEGVPDHYQIQLKCNYKWDGIIQYAKTKGLTVKEDKEKKFLVIYKE